MRNRSGTFGYIVEMRLLSIPDSLRDDVKAVRVRALCISRRLSSNLLRNYTHFLPSCAEVLGPHFAVVVFACPRGNSRRRYANSVCFVSRSFYCENERMEVPKTRRDRCLQSSKEYCLRETRCFLFSFFASCRAYGYHHHYYYYHCCYHPLSLATTMTSSFFVCVPQVVWTCFCSFVCCISVCHCPGKYSINVQRRIDSVRVSTLNVLLVILIFVTYN